MKRLLITIPLLLLTVGCATSTPPLADTDFDWRKGRVHGTTYGMPYTFKGDEIEVQLFSDTTGKLQGTHKLNIEQDEIQYKLKYRF